MRHGARFVSPYVDSRSPAHGRSRRVELFWLLGILLLALIAASACTDEKAAPCRPEVAGGRIRGTVRLGHQPIAGLVRATRIPAKGQNEAVIDISPDSATGGYEMDVPAGRYVVAYARQNWGGQYYEFSAAGMRYGDLPPDTLVVNDPLHPLIVDFNLATIRVHLDLVTELDGEYAYVVIHPKGRTSPSTYRTFVNSGNSRIVNGEADIEIWGILPGESKVEIDLARRDYMCYCPWDGEHFWIPGTRDSTQTPWIPIGVGQAVDVSGAIQPDPARIEGEIVGAWLRAGSVSAPTVTLLGADSTLVMGEHAVGEGGAFGLNVYLPEPVKILVRQEGISQWIGGASFRTAPAFPLTRGQTTSGARLVGCGLQLDATNSAVAFGSSDVRVRLFDAESLAPIASWSPQTIPPGAILRICNLRPGAYRVQLDVAYRFDNDWLPQWYDRAHRPEDAQIIRIAQEGDLVTLPIVLERGGRIAGVVHDTPESSSEFYVYVTRSDDPMIWSRGWAWPEHEFSFTGLPDGDWKVGVRRMSEPLEVPDVPPSGTVWFPSTTDWATAGVIEIRDGAEVTGLEIQAEGH
jgi:hypothetical protein